MNFIKILVILLPWALIHQNLLGSRQTFTDGPRLAVHLTIWRRRCPIPGNPWFFESKFLSSKNRSKVELKCSIPCILAIGELPICSKACKNINNLEHHFQPLAVKFKIMFCRNQVYILPPYHITYIITVGSNYMI